MVALPSVSEWACIHNEINNAVEGNVARLVQLPKTARATPNADKIARRHHHRSHAIDRNPASELDGWRLAERAWPKTGVPTAEKVAGHAGASGNGIQ